MLSLAAAEGKRVADSDIPGKSYFVSCPWTGGGKCHLYYWGHIAAGKVEKVQSCSFGPDANNKLTKLAGWQNTL